MNPVPDEGRCAWCDVAPAWIRSYWGDPLCRRCCRYAADKFDRDGRWPPQPEEDAT